MLVASFHVHLYQKWSSFGVQAPTQQESKSCPKINPCLSVSHQVELMCNIWANPVLIFLVQARQYLLKIAISDDTGVLLHQDRFATHMIRIRSCGSTTTPQSGYLLRSPSVNIWAKGRCERNSYWLEVGEMVLNCNSWVSRIWCRIHADVKLALHLSGPRDIVSPIWVGSQHRS